MATVQCGFLKHMYYTYYFKWMISIIGTVLFCGEIGHRSSSFRVLRIAVMVMIEIPTQAYFVQS
jgi:hypothetical protein